MTRRLLAALCVTALGFLWTAQAADPIKAPPTKDRKTDPTDKVDFDALRLAHEQKQLKQEFLEFQHQLLRLAQNLELSNKPENKDKAKMLREALELAAKGGVSLRFNQLIEKLSSPKAVDDLDALIKAGQINQDLRRDLQILLNILLSDNRAELLKRERQRVEKLLEELKDVIRKQERVRAQTEIAKRDPKEIGKDQANVTDQTRKLIGKGKDSASNEGKRGEAKDAKNGDGKDGKDGHGEGKKDTADNKSDGKTEDGKGKDGKDGEGKDGKQGEAKDGKGDEGKDGKQSEAKDGKGGEGKEGQAKEGKSGEGKEGKGKDGEGKEGKGGKAGEAKDGKSGEGKGGEGKEGQGKDGKGGDGKEGQGKDGKSGDGKEGQGKDGKSGDGKAGEAKDGKSSNGGNGKPGENKANKSGTGKPSEGKPSQPKDAKGSGKPGDGKPGKPGDGKPGEGKTGKPGEGKTGKPSDGKGKGDGKGEGKGQSKSGSPSSGQASQSKSGGQQGQPGQQGQGKGDQNNQQPQNQQPQDQDPARKKIADATENQKKAEDELKKPDNPGASEEQDKALQKLNDAKKKLEDLLRQLREEEIERLLAALQSRCQEMLRIQKEIRQGTVDTDARITELVKILKNRAALEKDTDYRAQKQKSLEMSDKEEDLVKMANVAIRLIEEEGSAIAFAEVFKQVRNDMDKVARRLKATDVGPVTQTIEQDIIDTLEEMIKALEKARQENKNKKSKPSKPGQPGKPGDQDLIDLLAELKMIRSMQVRVNKRTEDYHKFYPAHEQAPDPVTVKDPKAREDLERILDELKDLSDRQDNIKRITRDIGKGKNKTRD